MHPFLNIALRATRTANEQIQLLLEREERSLQEPEKLRKILDRVDLMFYDDVERALSRAYPRHTIRQLSPGQIPTPAKGSKQVKRDQAGENTQTRAARGNPDSRQSNDTGAITWYVTTAHNRISLMRGLRDWCFTLTCYRGETVEHAVVVCPATGDEYTASRGSGAALNGRRLRASRVQDPAVALVSSNLLQDLQGDHRSANLAALVELDKLCFAQRLAYCVPLALCEVAAGQTDATLCQSLDPADLPAAMLIASEAGALASDLLGNPFHTKSTELLCTTPALLKKLLPPLRKVMQAA